MVKNPPVSAGHRNSVPESGRCPGEEMATHSSILAWEIPWTEVAGEVQSTGAQRVGHVLATEHATGTLLCNSYHK